MIKVDVLDNHGIYSNISTDVKKIQKLSAPKSDMKTPKNQQVENNRGTCTPDQGIGDTYGVLWYPN